MSTVISVLEILFRAILPGYVSCVTLFGMKQIISEPTRVTFQSSTLIERIAATNCNNIKESGMLNTGLKPGIHIVVEGR